MSVHSHPHRVDYPHKGHVTDAGFCRGHSDPSIRRPSGIPNLRANTPNGVANKKVQFQIDICLSKIQAVRDLLKFNRSDLGLQHELESLNQTLADLRKREYYPIPKAQPKQKVPKQSARLSPSIASTTSQGSTPSVKSDRAVPLMSSDSENSPSLPATPPKELSLHDYLVPSSPVEEDRQSVVSEASSFDLVQALTQSKDPEAEALEELAAKAEKERLEKEAAIPAYLASADKVRQVFAITVSNVVDGHQIPMIVEPAEPLVSEFQGADHYNRTTYYDLEYARAEHALPRIRSDFKTEKERYIRERDLHNQFIERVLPLISDEETRRKLESYRVPLDLPDDPYVDPIAVTTFDTFRPHYEYHSAPALDSAERRQLEEQAKGMTAEEIRAATKEHEEFLAGLQDTQINMTQDDPNIKKVVDLVKKMGIGLPKTYIKSYAHLKRDHQIIAQHSNQFEKYMDDLDGAAGDYQARRLELQQRRKQEMCHYIEARVNCGPALEQAMSEFQQA
jgi:hypothetical protein